MMLIAVASGGALGASLRYLTGGWALRTFGPGFPYGTLTVNVAGSLAMGILAALFIARGQGAASPVAAFAMTGVLGGFTTFSAFSLDAVLLLEKGRMLAALGYVGGSVVASLAALFAGLALTRAVLS